MSNQTNSRQTCRKCGTIHDDGDDHKFLGVVPLRCAYAEQFGWECGRMLFEIWCPTCGEFHEPATLCYDDGE